MDLLQQASGVMGGPESMGPPLPVVPPGLQGPQQPPSIKDLSELFSVYMMALLVICLKKTQFRVLDIFIYFGVWFFCLCMVFHLYCHHY